VQQPRLPLAIAAGMPRTLAIAARYADVWITYGDTSYRELSPEATQRIVTEQAALLEAACGDAGRDPAEIQRLFLIGNSEERPLASTAAFEEFAERYRALGFTDLVLHHPRPDDPVWNEPETIVEQVATEVLPRLKRK
jgi:alkanesulfonate monooxygenase SsuD/methylene tetrahydromethanopterin reductase-like flavin-dependent oxidoreductase (luciferase family)